MKPFLSEIASGPVPRRVSRTAKVVYGQREVLIGGNAPVVVQSMTNTDTADAIGTAIQIKELARAYRQWVLRSTAGWGRSSQTT